MAKAEASYRSKERAEVVRRRTLKLSNTQGAEQTSLSGDTALKEPEREAVVLYYFAGLSQADIARQLGMSHGNVRVMLHRAKQRLRNLLED